MNTLSLRNIKTVILTSLFAVAMVLSLSMFVGRASAVADCNDASVTGAEKLKCNACLGAGGGDYVPSTGPGVSGKCGDVAGEDTQAKVSDIANKVINIFSFAVGIVSVIMIMVGGFKYVTSQGDANSITSAKNTILYAIVGLVIVAFAQIIVRFVLGKI